jgi:multisubunit Na+/H+ antiporter MnhF subunit
LLSSGLAGAIGLFAVPAVRTRLSNSFGANDQGSSARWDAFRIFPGQMSGHWLLGRGFGAPELTNATAAAATNYVANAPLLTVYRGGVVVGLAFTALMLTAGLHAWRLLRGSRFETVVVGAGYLGVMLVALQLDFPVVTLSPATLTFALLLAFVARPEATADPANEISEHALSSGDIELEAAHG